MLRKQQRRKAALKATEKDLNVKLSNQANGITHLQLSHLHTCSFSSSLTPYAIIDIPNLNRMDRSNQHSQHLQNHQVKQEHHLIQHHQHQQQQLQHNHHLNLHKHLQIQRQQNQYHHHHKTSNQINNSRPNLNADTELARRNGFATPSGLSTSAYDMPSSSGVPSPLTVCSPITPKRDSKLHISSLVTSPENDIDFHRSS